MREKYKLFLIVLIIIFIALSSFIVKKISAPQNDPCIIGEHLNLGTVDFPTSTKITEAQRHFLLGLRYLHNFMYPLALREFTLAKKADPSFALSYWGIAMSYQWPLWSYVDKAKGQVILYQLDDQQNVPMTDLEKQLIAAVKLIYSDGTVVENDKKYVGAMASLFHQYPDNPDIASFYALSLLGYVADAPLANDAAASLQQAQGILKLFLKKYPHHPGIIHYYIHAMDVPNSPSPKEGLTVTNDIYHVLSDSSHVLHMPAHLYTEVGDWPAAAHANLLSMDASNRLCRFLETNSIHLDAPIVTCSSSHNKKVVKWSDKNWYACDADNFYHSAEWLQYEYLQMGQYKKANKIALHMNKVVNIIGEPMYDFWLYRTRARQILYTNDWQPLKTLSPAIISEEGDSLWAAYSESGILLAEGLQAIHNHQTIFLPEIEKRYQKIISILDKKNEGGFKNACLLAQLEFLAAKEYYINKNTQASTVLLEKALKVQEKLQESQEPLTLPFIPAQEFYAEILLQHPSKDYVIQAIALYRNELKFNVNRSQAFMGLARAETELGNLKNADYWYRKVVLQFKNADHIPAPPKARSYLSL